MVVCLGCHGVAGAGEAEGERVRGPQRHGARERLEVGEEVFEEHLHKKKNPLKKWIQKKCIKNGGGEKGKARSATTARSWGGDPESSWNACLSVYAALFRRYSGAIQALFRLYSGSIQALFRLYSGSIQTLFKLY